MPRRTRKLTVTASFESNRLEEQNISMAYELVFPVKQGGQRTTKRSVPKKVEEISMHQIQLLSAVSSL